MENIKNCDKKTCPIPFKIFFKEESGLSNSSKNVIEIKIKKVVKYSAYLMKQKHSSFLMLILRTLSYTRHRNCIQDFEDIFARPQVSRRCYDKAIPLHSVFPKPVQVWQFNFTTAPVSTKPREDEASWEINAKANPVATLKRVMSRRRRVIEFSLFSLSLTFSLSHQFALSSAPCMPKKIAGLACQNLPDAAVCFPCRGAKAEEQKRVEEGRGRKPRREEEHRARTQQDGMVKRAEDGRCLVVCRIWVSDLGPRPAVGRRVCQGNLFSRPSLRVPLAPLSPSFSSRCSLLGLPLTPFLPMSRPARCRSFYTFRSSLSRELKTGRESCPSTIFTALFARVMETFDVREKVFRERWIQREERVRRDAERKREKAFRTVRGTRSSGSWWSGWKCWANGNGSSLLDIDRTSENAYRVRSNSRNTLEYQRTTEYSENLLERWCVIRNTTVNSWKIELDYK